MSLASLARSGGSWRYELARRAYETYLGAWYTITSRRPVGTNVFEEEWDALVVLDACRVDALRAVADEYAFIEDVGTRLSVGSHSMEWLAKTFTGDHRETIRRTSYITANTHAQLLFVDGDRPPYERTVPGWPDWNVVGSGAFHRLEQVWKYGHDDRLGNTPPRYVTDRLVDAGRNDDADRLVAHYMQPHAPYVADAVENGGEPGPVEREPLEALAAGDADREEVWALYLDNLRLVLDEVALALENLDAQKVVITADHGEALGEWGDVDHREGTPLPAVKRVPWVETTARDDKTHVPEPRPTTGAAASTDVESHLQDLGYL